MKTMNEKYRDASEHNCCGKCGYCNDCGDCKKYGCDRTNHSVHLESME